MRQFVIFFLTIQLLLIFAVKTSYAAALVDPAQCTISATKTELFADSSTKTYITVAVKNSGSNPVSNIQVDLTTDRPDSDYISQPSSFTNSNGLCTGYVIGIYGSISNGTSSISAYIVTEDTSIDDTVFVYFKDVEDYPFFDDFEYSTQGGDNTTPDAFHEWTKGRVNASAVNLCWEHGDPIGGDDAANDNTSGPTTGYNSSYCWATNLSGGYGTSGTNVYNQYMWLRSPAVDLRISSTPLLVFRDWSDIEDPSSSTYWDYAEIVAYNANNLLDSYVISTPYNTDHTWAYTSFSIPEALVGKLVYVELRLHMDPGYSEAGWYVDDFLVREQTSPDTSTITADSSSLNVDIAETTIVTVTAKDVFGNVLPYVMVELTSTSSNDHISPGSVETGSDGKAEFTVYCDTVELVTYSAEAESLPLTATVDIEYYSRSKWVVINEIGWAGSSTGNFEYIELFNTTNDTLILTGWKLGDGTDTVSSSFNSKSIGSQNFLLIEYSEITTPAAADIITSSLTLNDAGEKLVLMDENNYAVDKADFSGGWTAGNSSYYAAELITGSENWDTANNTIFLNNNSQIAYGTPKANNSAGVSSANSSVTSDTTQLTAGETAVISFMIKNFDNQPVVNIACNMSSSRGSIIDTITAPAATDNDGLSTGYVYTRTSGTSVITVNTPTNITDTITLSWASDTVSLSQSYVSASSLAGAGGEDTVEVFIYLLDQFSNAVTGESATFTSTLGDSIAPGTLTNSSGKTTGYLSSVYWGTAVITGLFGGASITNTASVFFDTLLSLPMYETFPTTIFNPQYWLDTSNATIVTNAAAEPSSPNSLRIGVADGSYATTKKIDLSDYSTDNVECYLYYEQSSNSANRNLQVDYMSTSSWVTLFIIPYYPYYTTSFKKREIVLPSGAFHAGFQLRFTKINATNYYYIDDLVLRARPSVVLSQLTSTTGDTADMTDSAFVTVTVKDAAGKTLTGEDVTLYTDRTSSDSITVNPVTTGSNGAANFYVKSKTSGTSIFTASIGSLELNDTAYCNFIPGIVNSDSSEITAQTNVSIGNNASALVTVTLKDGYGNLVPNKSVTLDTSGIGDTITQPAAVTNSNGQAYGYVQSDDTGICYVSASDTTDSIAVTDSTAVTFIIPSIVINEIMYNPPLSDPQDEWFELYNASSDTIIIDTYYITNDIDTFLLVDTSFPANSYLVFSYSVNGGNGNIGSDSVYGACAANFELYNNTSKISIYDSQSVCIDQVEYYNNWSSAPHLDDNDGRSLERILPQGASNSSENWDYSRTDTGTPGTINTMRIVNSQLSANDTYYASLTDSIFVTVTLLDFFNNVVSGETVLLGSSISGDTLLQPVSVTNSNGIAAGYIKSTVSGYRSITIDTPAGCTAAVTIRALPDVSNSFISGDTGAVANLTDSAQIAVFLLNAGNVPLAGETVYISSNRGNDSLPSIYQATNISGTTYFNIKSTQSGVSVISIDTPDISDTFGITFTSDSTSAETSSISYINQGIINLSNIQIDVYLYDTFGNPVVDHSVIIETAAARYNDTLTQPASVTNDSGYTFGYVSSPETGVAYFRVIDSTDSIAVSDTAKITFIEPSMVINEIMYYPQYNDNGNGEWIELYNLSSDTTDIGGWYLKDNTSGSHIIAPGTEVGPNGYFLLEYDESATPITADDIYGDDASGLLFSNGSESILLLNDSGVVVDYLPYSSGWHSECNGNGKSLEKVVSESSEINSTYWAASTADSGTPGAVNSVRISNTELAVIINTAKSNNSDTCRIKLTLKDKLNNTVTENVYFGISSSRDALDTLTPSVFYSGQSSETYINITSFANGQAVISIDTPSYLTDTAVITFYNNLPDTVTLLKPDNNIDTFARKPFFTWSIPVDNDNDSLQFKIEIASDLSFTDITDSGNSSIDTTNFSYFNGTLWDSFPTSGVLQGSDSAGYFPENDIIGDSHYWRVMVDDGKGFYGTSTIRVFNPVPEIQITNSIDTVSLNGVNYSDTGLIPGVTMHVTLTAQNIGCDTAENVIIHIPVPANTLYKDTFIIYPGCIPEWSIVVSPDQSYSSSDYNSSPPSPLSLTKWFRVKKSQMSIDETINNVIQFTVK